MSNLASIIFMNINVHLSLSYPFPHPTHFKLIKYSTALIIVVLEAISAKCRWRPSQSSCRTPQCEAHNRAGVVDTCGALVWGCASMYVCMSVRNGFTIEIYGFKHSLRIFWHVPSGCHRAMAWSKAWRSRSRTRNNTRTGDVWKTLSKRMKDDKITMIRNDWRVTTRAIYFARWLVNR